jgi:phospholipid/cholesterol/gamma-HCH transport system substrate-binding protein
METKVNYALVGAFVLVFSIAIVAVVLWIASGGTTGKAYDTYLAYFTESVSGLNLQAPVKYRGVSVGFVKEIGLDTEDPDRVRLVLSIERGVPIRQGTVATLSAQGLTGIAFLDLEGGSVDSPLLVRAEDGSDPVIATRPSLFRRLDTQTSALVSNLSQTAQRVNTLLDEETRAALQRTIRDLDTVVHALAGRSGAISADAARTLENSARASAALTETLRDIARSAEAVQLAAEQTERTSAAMQATATDATIGVQQLRSETLPELRRLLSEARAVTGSVGRLTKELEQSPNALVIGREPTPPGPGE